MYTKCDISFYFNIFTEIILDVCNRLPEILLLLTAEFCISSLPYYFREQEADKGRLTV